MQKSCTQCRDQFEIPDDDLDFYDKVSPVFNAKKYMIPPPEWCPQCRLRRRLCFRNERSLHPRACDKCQRRIVSIHDEHAPFPVYCNTCWWGDSWDPLSFGQPLDLSRSFFDQMRDLWQRVPQITAMNDDGIGSENCEYCQDFAFGKDCYRVVGSWYDQDCYYCDATSRAKNMVDCQCVNLDSEMTYESIDSVRLYRCSFLQNSENCSDCFFGFDLKGCSDCFGCVNLRQKKYCIFNEQYSPEEYRRKRAEFPTDSREGLEHLKTQFFEWATQFPKRAMVLNSCEDSKGENLYHCKSCYGFDSFDGDHSKYFLKCDNPVWCQDVFNSGRPQWSYDCITPDDSYMVLFSLWCWKCKYVLYSDNCHSSEHLFGCVSLKRGRYCILNKQYTKEEYEDLVPRIIEHMRNDNGGGVAMNPSVASGSWGAFFPTALSPFAYNQTIANEYFPLSKDEAAKDGYRWADANPKEYQPATMEPPDRIADVPDSIVDAMLACRLCRKNYRILQKELAYYRDLRLPVPDKCAECRHRERWLRRTPRNLYDRECAKCAKGIETTYAPDRPEIVYCERCYLETVY